jgi:hypothetical protein
VGHFLPTWNWIRIQQLILMRIHADPDPQPGTTHRFIQKIRQKNRAKESRNRLPHLPHPHLLFDQRKPLPLLCPCRYPRVEPGRSQKWTLEDQLLILAEYVVD